jgi:hypothetical protein
MQECGDLALIVSISVASIVRRVAAVNVNGFQLTLIDSQGQHRQPTRRTVRGDIMPGHVFEQLDAICRHGKASKYNECQYQSMHVCFHVYVYV